MHVVLSLANPHNDYIFYILYTVLSFFDFVRLCTQIIRKIKVFHSVLGFIMFVWVYKHIYRNKYKVGKNNNNDNNSNISNSFHSLSK